MDAKDKRIIVLGGGDTATDCIGTCLRMVSFLEQKAQNSMLLCIVIYFTCLNFNIFTFQGAKSVTAFEILPQPGEVRKADNPWPEWPLIFRIDYGHDEAKSITGKDPRTYSVSTKVRSIEIQLTVTKAVFYLQSDTKARSHLR